MAHLTPAERRAFPRSEYMPADVVSRLSRSELADRLVYSTELDRRIAKTALPAQKRSITQELIAMLRAQPRSTTEHDVAQRIAKAASVPNVDQGGAIRRSAQQLLAEQPPAPRNLDADLIVKATAGEDGLMLCCDENGTVVGVCQQSALTPVLLPSQISKARAAPAGYAALYDKDAKFLGYAKPEDIDDPATAQAKNTGPVNLGGTTGMGRTTGRGESRPPLPGDVPGRQVVKAAQRAPVRTADGRVALLRDLPPRNRRG
jgi:hypothetical protein